MNGKERRNIREKGKKKLREWYERKKRKREREREFVAKVKGK